MENPSTVVNLWTPFAISTQLEQMPSHAGPLSLERDRPTMAHALTIYSPTASSLRSSLWQQTSCQRWRGQTIALYGGN